MNKPKTQAEIDAFEQWTEYEERKHDRIARNASTILAGMLSTSSPRYMNLDDACMRDHAEGEAFRIEAEVTRRLEATDA